MRKCGEMAMGLCVLISSHCVLLLLSSRRARSRRYRTRICMRRSTTMMRLVRGQGQGGLAIQGRQRRQGARQPPGLGRQPHNQQSHRALASPSIGPRTQWVGSLARSRAAVAPRIPVDGRAVCYTTTGSISGTSWMVERIERYGEVRCAGRGGCPAYTTDTL